MSAPGLPVIKGFPHLRTQIRFFTFDSDAVSAYPSATEVSNNSRATTRKELIAITGIDELIVRKNSINLLQGHVNALEYCHDMFGLPKADDILKYFN